MKNRGIAVVSILGIMLLALSVPAPWWTAEVRPPAAESSSASLNLYSFVFRTSSFSCTAVLLFYSYGSCPIIGSGSKLGSLAFYTFWSLAFLVLSLVLDAVSLSSLLRPLTKDQLKWTLVASAASSAFSILLFLGALLSASFSFIGMNPLFGSSTTKVEQGDLVVSWGLAFGFSLVVASLFVQSFQAYFATRA